MRLPWAVPKLRPSLSATGRAIYPHSHLTPSRRRRAVVSMPMQGSCSTTIATPTTSWSRTASRSCSTTSRLSWRRSTSSTTTRAQATPTWPRRWFACSYAYAATSHDGHEIASPLVHGITYRSHLTGRPRARRPRGGRRTTVRCEDQVTRHGPFRAVTSVAAVPGTLRVASAIAPASACLCCRLDRREGCCDAVSGGFTAVGDLRLGVLTEPLLEHSKPCGWELPGLRNLRSALDRGEGVTPTCAGGQDDKGELPAWVRHYDLRARFPRPVPKLVPPC